MPRIYTIKGIIYDTITFNMHCLWEFAGNRGKIISEAPKTNNRRTVLQNVKNTSKRGRNALHSPRF